MIGVPLYGATTLSSQTFDGILITDLARQFEPLTMSIGAGLVKCETILGEGVLGGVTHHND